MSTLNSVLCNVHVCNFSAVVVVIGVTIGCDCLLPSIFHHSVGGSEK